MITMYKQESMLLHTRIAHVVVIFTRKMPVIVQLVGLPSDFILVSLAEYTMKQKIIQLTVVISNCSDRID